MSSNKYLSAISAALLLFSGVASADVVTFEFTGTVTYGGNLASTGSQIVGHFTYDTKTKPAYSYPDYAYYQVPEIYGMSATVEGHQVSGKNVNVLVWDNFDGNVEDFVTVSSGSILVDDNFYPDGAFSFTLASLPGETKVINNINLPSSLDLNQFNSFAGGTIQKDGGQTGQLLQYSIDSIAVIQVCHYPNANSNALKCVDY